MSEQQPSPEINKQNKNFTIQEGLDGTSFEVTEKISADGNQYSVTFEKDGKTFTGTAPIAEPRGTAVLDALIELNNTSKDIYTVKWDI